MHESKTFDVSTVAGMDRAERYQKLLYAKYDIVEVKPLGLTRVVITGKKGA